jgi:hypothetical protein
MLLRDFLSDRGAALCLGGKVLQLQVERGDLASRLKQANQRSVIPIINFCIT